MQTTAPVELKKQRIIVLSSTIVLAAVCWILAFWYTNKTDYAKQLIIFYSFFNNPQGTSKWLDLWQYFYQFALTAVFFIAIPWLICKYYLKQDFVQLCWRFKPSKIALIVCAIVYPLVIASTFVSAVDPDLMSEYPLSKLAGSNWLIFVVYELGYFVYFLGYETLFRGYLQFGLKGSKINTKELIAILLIQTAITILFHAGKPYSEIYAAAIFGPVIGYVALRFDSIWYGLIIHYIMNVSMDYLILRNMHLLPSTIL